jgi:acetyl-CoA carboxylase carboxyl transferase subunit beta
VRSRRPERPGIRRLLHISASELLPLSGTGQGENEPGLLLALARLGGEACVIVGQDREAQRSRGALGPGALRAARRGMRLARELDLPLVTIIDTPGAALSPAAEEGGLAGEIARSLADLIAHPTATVSVLLGEGTGGGALALFPADASIAAQHAWLSPLPPEGASVIVHRVTDRAAEMAQEQGVWASRLLADGIVDFVVEERPDAADEPEQFSRRMGDAIASVLHALRRRDARERLAARHDRYRLLGADR